MSNHITKDQFIKSANTSFTKIFQRSPVDDQELLGYVLAVWMTTETLRSVPVECASLSGRVVEYMYGTDTLKTYSILDGIRIFARALNTLETMYALGTMQAEVEKALQKEPLGKCS